MMKRSGLSKAKILLALALPQDFWLRNSDQDLPRREFAPVSNQVRWTTPHPSSVKHCAACWSKSFERTVFPVIGVPRIWMTRSSRISWSSLLTVESRRAISESNVKRVRESSVGSTKAAPDSPSNALLVWWSEAIGRALAGGTDKNVSLLLGDATRTH